MGETTKLAFHNFVKCEMFLEIKSAFNSFKDMRAGFYENKLEIRSLFESYSVLVDLQTSSS